jgi:hypothetical protein
MEFLEYRAQLAAVLCTSFFWWLFTRRSIQHRAARLAVRSLGLIAFVPAFLVTLLLLLGLGCERRSALVKSPDGKHVARVLVNIGSAVDIDYATVIVRDRFSPIDHTAYFGPGDYDANQAVEPQLKWIDNQHLLVNYYDDWGASYPQQCHTYVDGIVVQCVSHK